MKKSTLLLASLLLITIFAKSQPINFSWSRGMGGHGNSEGSVGIVKDASGNIYVTGEFSGTRTFGTFSLTSAGVSDMFVAKYSPAGTCLWVTGGGANFSSSYGGKITVSGGDVFVAGSFSNILAIGTQAVSSFGTKDIFVAGLDTATGTCNWLYNAGSIFEDVPYGIVPATGGGFYLCGTFTGTATFGTNVVASSSLVDFDVFYAKYSASGTCLWVNRIGSTGADRAYDIKELPSGHILITGAYEGSVLFGPGTTLTSTGFTDLFLAKFDSNGQLAWASSGGCVKNSDQGRAISFDPSGNIYVTGFIGDTAVFGSIVINNPGGVNLMTAKFSPAGVCSWVVFGGSIADDVGFGIVTDSGGSSYVTGYISGNCYFGSTQITGVNVVDIVIIKYDLNGVLRWITRVGGSGYDKGKAILLDVNGYVHVAGDYENGAVFGSVGLPADPGVIGTFLTRMGGGTVGIDEVEKTPFSLYPNPSRDFIQLDLQEITDDAFTVSLFTLDGKVALTQTLSRQDAVAGYKLELGSVAAGSYVLKLETSKGDFSKTLVVQ